MNPIIYSDKMLTNLKHNLNSGFRFITYPKFIFLCGKAYDEENYNKSNRGTISQYIETKTKGTYFVLSEKIWEENFSSSIDLLTFEEFLAEVSDCIIIFVESAGSFCELGAFAYADKIFGDKLLIVMDPKYKDDKSFINTGPIEKLKVDGSKIVYASLDGRGLLSSRELRRTIEELACEFSTRFARKNIRTTNTKQDSVILNSFIVELLEIIKVFQPVSRADLLEIYKRLKGFDYFKFVKRNGEAFHNEIGIDYIFKLLVTVGLIQEKDNFLSLKSSNDTQDLMLGCSVTLKNRERNKLLCRKYRYKQKVT